MFFQLTVCQKTTEMKNMQSTRMTTGHVLRNYTHAMLSQGKELGKFFKDIFNEYLFVLSNFKYLYIECYLLDFCSMK